MPIKLEQMIHISFAHIYHIIRSEIQAGERERISKQRLFCNCESLSNDHLLDALYTRVTILREGRSQKVFRYYDVTTKMPCYECRGVKVYRSRNFQKISCKEIYYEYIERSEHYIAEILT